MGRAEFAHHPALPRCYAAGIRLALEVEILGRSCGFLVHYPGSSRFTFSRDEARENGFTGERRGGTFTRSIAQKSAAYHKNLQRRKERTVMKVRIAGASGALGTPLTRALIAGGHEVLGLARSPESMDRLTPIGAHPILANVMDRDDLLRAIKGVQADAVIHALTALKKTPLRHQDMYATNALRDVGTTHLLAAAREVGAHRFVAESMTLGYGYGDWGDKVITQDGPLAPAGSSSQLERHVSGFRSLERQIWEATQAGWIEWISLRYGYFYGPASLVPILETLPRRSLPLPDGGRGFTSWIYLKNPPPPTHPPHHHTTPPHPTTIFDN